MRERADRAGFARNDSKTGKAGLSCYILPNRSRSRRKQSKGFKQILEYFRTSLRNTKIKGL